MMTRNAVLALIVSILLFGNEDSRAQDQDVPGSSDHPMISRYAGSVIYGYEVQEFNEFALPLGPAEGAGVPSKKESLEGKITRILYGGPDGRSTLEIYKNYRSVLRRDGRGNRGDRSHRNLWHLLRHG